MAGVASAAGGAAKWIATSLVEEGKYLYGIQDVARSIQDDLQHLQVFLERVDDTPRRLLQVDGQLLLFTNKIREVAFRAEDIIDTYVVDVGPKIYKKNFFFKFTSLVFHWYPVHMLRKEIEAIQQQIQEAKNRYESFGSILQLSTSSNHQQQGIGHYPENYTHFVDVNVVGIDDAVSQLVHQLIDPEGEFKVVGIIGTGGGGKTTLATQLYQHSKVASRFPHRAFVSVSQEWSTKDLFTRIFKQFMGDHITVPSSEPGIVREVYEFLKEKQFLIVLDDMWKNGDWDVIYPMFPQSNKEGKVIITTRIKEVVLHADSRCVIHEPSLLTEDQKWELFRNIAVEGRAQIENNGEFEKLGKQMLGKCEGIPLTIVTLAGILRTKQVLYQWEEIGKAYFENILQGMGGKNYGVVEDMLELSYLVLPTHLKQCFLYLSCFPEDYMFEAETVICMWIAEGFIMNDLQQRWGTLEDAGRHLLDELAQRCVLQVTSRNFMRKISSFRLHDLMREFCIKAAKECQFFEMITSTYDTVNVGRSSQPRRISIISRNVDINNSQLRTLTQFGAPHDGKPMKTLETIHEKFKLLRVLRIENVRIGGLPNQIWELIQLRYLSIHRAGITALPKSIRNLRNLLCLEWYESELYLEKYEVPNDLACKMENLRWLTLPGLKRFFSNSESLGIRGCNKLHTLRSGAGKWMTNDLPSVSPAIRNLFIENLSEEEELDAIYGCPSIIQDRLSSLQICSSRGGGRVSTPFKVVKEFYGLEFELLKLRHCTTLQELNLNNCTIPNPNFPPGLVDLTLTYNRYKRDDLMQLLGELLHLKSLTLQPYSYMGTQLSCGGDGAFPQLQKLRLGLLPNLEEWRMEEGAICRLRKMVINSCDKLKRLPECIRSITTLKELHIEFMPEEFCSRLGYGESSSVGEDRHIIQHIPTVKFG